MNPLLPPGLIAAISLLFAPIVPLQAREPRRPAADLVDPTPQEHFDSKVRRSPRPPRVREWSPRRFFYWRPTFISPQRSAPEYVRDLEFKQNLVVPDSTPLPTPVSTPAVPPVPAPTAIPEAPSSASPPLVVASAPPPMRVPLFPVPPPNPAPEIPPPAGPPPDAPFVSGGPDLARLERATPRVQVWRSGSDTPQRPDRQSRGRHQAFVAGTAPVTIVLRFHPLVAHRPVAIFPSRGVTTNPQGSVPVGGSGEIAIAVQLDATQSHGQIRFRLDTVDTIVRVTRAPSQAVAAAEQASIGRP
jgi:hypothetical protein